MQFIRMRLIKNRTNYLKTKSLLFEKKGGFMLSIIADLISLITDILSNYLWYSDERKNTKSNK